MINTDKSTRLLANFGELVSKGTFDMTSLKKGRFPDHVFSRWKWFFSPLYLMLNRALSAALSD
jgi:hypothetical protein